MKKPLIAGCNQGFVFEMVECWLLAIASFDRIFQRAQTRSGG